jgi:acyl-CoA synthetase (AMP-forming)/AMP-acid ligase II
VLPIRRFFDRATASPGRIAISGADGDLTYAELRASVNALACAFQRLDATDGSRVGICARNTTQHLIALLATYAAGKVWVPLNPRNGRGELDAMIAVTQPSLIVADRASLERFTMIDRPLVLAESAADTAQVDTKQPDAHDGVATVRALIAQYAGDAPTTIERREDDAHIIKFSGGSTGTPKPVVQSVRCVNAQADGIRDFFAFHQDDVNLIAAPLTHGASCFVLPILEVGGRHVLLEDAQAPRVLEAIATFRVTTMYAPPTLLYALMLQTDAPAVARASLRHVIYSAAPMTPERIRECQAFFGPVIETAYGQVEAPQIISGMRATELLDESNLTSVGRPSPVVRVGIMSPDGALLAAGDVGEIVVRGPLLMSGYLDQPTETARTIIDGWLHTGDVGLLDDRGYLFIRGRLRETINSGGFKIFPGDVEASLARHPAVSECAVFGVDDAKWGDAVNAAVVLQSGHAASADELITFVKRDLGSVKAPKRIWFVTSLERNAAGKISRAGVRNAVLRTQD